MIVDSDPALSKSTRATTSQQPLSTSSSSVPKAKTDTPLSPSTASHSSTKPERAVDVIELKDRFEKLARALLFLCILLGLTLAAESVGTSFYSNSTFQWKAMARILSSVGYKFDNWPNAVPFPVGVGIARSKSVIFVFVCIHDKSPFRHVPRCFRLVSLITDTPCLKL